MSERAASTVELSYAAAQMTVGWLVFGFMSSQVVTIGGLDALHRNPEPDPSVLTREPVPAAPDVGVPAPRGADMRMRHGLAEPGSPTGHLAGPPGPAPGAPGDDPFDDGHTDPCGQPREAAEQHKDQEGTA